MDYFILFICSACFGFNLYNWISGINRQLLTKVFAILGFVSAIIMYSVIEINK